MPRPWHDGGFQRLRRTGADFRRTIRSLFPERHQNNGGEEHAKSLKACIDLAKRHAQQRGCECGRSDQQRHDAVPVFDLRVEHAV